VTGGFVCCKLRLGLRPSRRLRGAKPIQFHEPAVPASADRRQSCDLFLFLCDAHDSTEPHRCEASKFGDGLPRNHDAAAGELDIQRMEAAGRIQDCPGDGGTARITSIADGCGLLCGCRRRQVRRQLEATVSWAMPAGDSDPKSTVVWPTARSERNQGSSDPATCFSSEDGWRGPRKHGP